MITIIIGTFVLFYLGESFAQATLDIRKWPENIRNTVAEASFFIGLLIAVTYMVAIAQFSWF